MRAIAKAALLVFEGGGSGACAVTTLLARDVWDLDPVAAIRSMAPKALGAAATGGAIALAALFQVGLAQAQTPPGAPSLAPVVVTSHKPTTDTASDAPLTTLTAGQITLSSTINLEQVLQSLPAVGFQGVNSADSGGYGVYFVDLHSLNFNRTLTVVDGLRYVVSGIKTDEAVDLNTIPVALIDHIDVLRSGSAPVFGPDAVAGVVNVVLKKNFDGLLLNIVGGGATHGGDGTGEINVTWGQNVDGGNLTLNLGYFDRGAIAQSSRDFAARPITAASIGANGVVSTIVGTPATPGGHALSADGTIDDVFTGSGRYHPFDAAVDSYNFAQGQDLQGSLKRETANLVGYYDIAPKIRASVEFLFSDRQSDVTLAPQILGLAGTQKNPEGFVIPVGAGGNPFDEPVELERVMSDVGPLQTHAAGFTYRAVARLEGQLGRVDWTLSYDRGESRTTYSVYNSVNLTKALQLASCAPATGCLSADFFGPNALSAAAVDDIRYTDVSRSDYTEDVGQMSAKTSVARLAGGPLVVQVGGELRSETGYTHMDPVDLAGDQSTPDTADTQGGYRSQEAYLDVVWPLLAERAWVKSLDLDTAVRYSHFNLFGGYPTWKVSASYAPDADIRFRATLGLARRQPAITEAFAGLSAGLTVVQDPCDSVSGLLANRVVAANCRAQGLAPNFVQTSPLIDIASGGNPHLTPEASHDVTAGMVLTPRFLPGLTATADYYRYDVRNAIDSLADTEADFIPDTCYETANLSSPLCALIQRTAGGPAAGQINRILALDSNLGAIVTDGLDVDVAYRHAFGNSLLLTLDWQSNYLLDFIVDEEGLSTQYAGSFASLVNVGSYARLKSLLATTVQTGPWSFEWRVHYIGPASLLDQDPAVTPFARAGTVWNHDLVASYRSNKVTYAVGADNVFNRRPPLLLDGLSNTDLNTYDVAGTFVYFHVSAAL